MIEGLEADLTGALIYASKNNDAYLNEVGNAAESITALSKSRNEMEIDLK